MPIPLIIHCTTSNHTDQKQQFITRTRQQTVNDFLNILEVKQHEEGIFMQVMQALEASGKVRPIPLTEFPFFLLQSRSKVFKSMPCIFEVVS